MAWLGSVYRYESGCIRIVWSDSECGHCDSVSQIGMRTKRKAIDGYYLDLLAKLVASLYLKPG